MIDTHCHINKYEYEDINLLLNDLYDNNIICINNGCDLDSNKDVLEIHNKYSNMYAAIGFHPSNMDNINLDFIVDNINNIVAIGEIGLDYYYTKDNIEEQKSLFKKQLEIAEKYNKPVIIHTRDSIQDTYDILKNYKVKGIIHSFNGSLDMANKFIDLGFKLGIGGVITFKNCKLKDVIKEVDIHNIVFETDSPYLSPEPLRGTTNSPFNLEHIISFVAKLKGIKKDELLNITNTTVSTLFDLDI